MTELTYKELNWIACTPTANKTIAANTIVIKPCPNAVRILLHGNPIFDIIESAYYNSESMRILPAAYTWFTNTTQNRISMIADAYGFTVRRCSKPERVYIFHDKRNKMRNIGQFDNQFYKFKPINHYIYEDSIPFPLEYNSDFSSWGMKYRGFNNYRDGDYSHYEQHG